MLSNAVRDGWNSELMDINKCYFHQLIFLSSFCLFVVFSAITLALAIEKEVQLCWRTVTFILFALGSFWDAFLYVVGHWLNLSRNIAPCASWFTMLLLSAIASSVNSDSLLLAGSYPCQVMWYIWALSVSLYCLPIWYQLFSLICPMLV